MTLLTVAPGVHLHVERRSVERGSVERRSVERGSVERGSVERGSVERGSVERGSVERGSVERRSVERRGSGSPVVLLHGFTGDVNTMLGLAERLETDTDVVLLDLVGHGRSSVPDDERAYSVDAMAAHVAAVGEECASGSMAVNAASGAEACASGAMAAHVAAVGEECASGSMAVNAASGGEGGASGAMAAHVAAVGEECASGSMAVNAASGGEGGASRSFHLVGYSMGGRVALTLACRRPGLLRSLTVIGASVGLSTEAERAERRESDQKLAESIEQDGLEAFVDRWMANPLFATQARLGEGFLAASRAQRMRNSAAGLARSLRGAGTGAMTPLHDDLESCPVPTVFIVGAQDPKFTRVAVDLAARMPNAATAVVDDSGHAAHLEQPDAVAAVIRGQLGSV